MTGSRSSSTFFMKHIILTLSLYYTQTIKKMTRINAPKTIETPQNAQACHPWVEIRDLEFFVCCESLYDFWGGGE